MPQSIVFGPFDDLLGNIIYKVTFIARPIYQSLAPKPYPSTPPQFADKPASPRSQTVHWQTFRL